MSALTLTTKTVLDGTGSSITTQLYDDPNHGDALGPVTAVILSDGTLLAPGQALAAASIPVVLTAAQMTTLTPLTTIPVTNAGTFAVQPTPPAIVLAAANINVPSSNTAAVVTFAAAGAGVAHVIDGIAWSYSAAVTGGRLTVTDDGNTVLDLDITAAGPGSISFPRPLKGTANKALVVTLAAGGVAVVGKVNILGKTTV